MIKTNGYLDWATYRPGIANKVYSEPNSGEWITCHSVVGEESDFEDGIPNRFLSTETYYDPELGMHRYTAYAAASSMFVLRKSGELIQMYPVTASTWTSGGRKANTRSWAIEAEGGQAPNYSEPLTPEAEASFVRLVREWERYSGKRAKAHITLVEHKEMAERFGYKPTACASDRYRFAWAKAEQREEDDMELRERVERLERLMTWRAAEDGPMTREYIDAELERLDRQINANVFRIFSNLEDEVDQQKADHADLLERFGQHINNHSAGAVVDHVHETSGPIIENEEK